VPGERAVVGKRPFPRKARGISSFFMIENRPRAADTLLYGLEWGFPMGVGYRYLSVPQSVLLLRLAVVPPGVNEMYLQAILEVKESGAP
jgi:hypothetical protein